MCHVWTCGISIRVLWVEELLYASACLMSCCNWLLIVFFNFYVAIVYNFAAYTIMCDNPASSVQAQIFTASRQELNPSGRTLSALMVESGLPPHLVLM